VYVDIEIEGTDDSNATASGTGVESFDSGADMPSSRAEPIMSTSQPSPRPSLAARDSYERREASEGPNPISVVEGLDRSNLPQCGADRELVSPSILVDEVFYFLDGSISTSIELRRKPVDTDACVLIDPGEMHQALMNILTNAAIAMSEKGGVLEVGAKIVGPDVLPVNGHEHTPTGPYLKLTIRDSGPGISDMDIEHVFEPFVASASAERACGLDLFVTRRIITEHGGYLTAQSEPEKGTSFHVYLPVVERKRGES
jgi:signal transduction histidine kinase